MQPRLLERYRGEVVSKLSSEFGYANVNQVPKLTKIVVNIGLGEATQNPKLLEKATEELAAITGQKPVTCRARKSVANFKLRQGQVIGCMVTLRGERMWEFLDRLLSVSLPRVRDFKGLSPKSFDGRGNCFLETGRADAALVDGDFFAEPEPLVTLSGPEPIHAEAKRTFESERLERWFGG